MKAVFQIIGALRDGGCSYSHTLIKYRELVHLCPGLREGEIQSEYELLLL